MPAQTEGVRSFGGGVGARALDRAVSAAHARMDVRFFHPGSSRKRTAGSGALLTALREQLPPRERRDGESRESRVVHGIFATGRYAPFIRSIEG
jgi:hypothetical protein